MFHGFHRKVFGVLSISLGAYTKVYNTLPNLAKTFFKNILASKPRYRRFFKESSPHLKPVTSNPINSRKA